MLLYHGTNGAWLDNILRNGLEARGSRPARDNWKHVAHRSNPRCVYLTDSYAPYFAFNAARGKEPICAVVEIDTDLLDQSAFLPDEDCWEQLGRGRDGISGTMSQRTIVWRRRIGSLDLDYVNAFTAKDNQSLPSWRLSLRALGTCAYYGSIPPCAITRAVSWPHLANARLMFVWDPTITLMNQRIVGDRYRELTRKLFAGEFEDPRDMSDDERSARFAIGGTILPPIEGWSLTDTQNSKSKIVDALVSAGKIRRSGHVLYAK